MATADSVFSDKINETHKPKVLFLCTGNTCRSQMAEGFARQLCQDRLQAYSAGVNPGTIDAKAVQVMAEIGIDISGQRPKSIDSLGALSFDAVITLCDHANETCPYFPGKVLRLHQGFADPPQLAANETDVESVLRIYRKVRDEIRSFVERLPETLHEHGLMTPPSAGS
ncbi:arsenate reductase ArsC [Desulfatirhabdium butyrativorans]|uniref:arsenate reductase ArsC n=1 Tax=Desulfatirhabdium butyrativorans TaxID=340467 RepID=UPI000402A231|nr:arsenate reductase ArsC [Desulfatirhabdium butyrativorans]